VNSQNMQTSTKKKKSKKSKQSESNTDKVSGDITDAGIITKKTKDRKGKKKSKQTPAPGKSKVNKTLPREPDISSDHKDTASDLDAAAHNVDLKESDKESNTIEGSNAEELKQERSSVGETLIKIIHTNKIAEDSHLEQDSEDTVDLNEDAVEQSKVEESHIREADVSSDQENTAPYPDAPNDSTDSKETDTVEGSNEEELKQEPFVKETLTGQTDAGETAEDAQAEQAPEDTVDHGDSVGKEQNHVEESPIQEPDISSEQNDAGADPNVDDGVAKVTAATPEKVEEIAVSQIYEAIQKITQSQGDIALHPATEEKSKADVTSSLLEASANEIMQNKVTWASPESSLQHAIAKMQQTNAGYVMVGQNGALEGVVSKSDITKAMSPFLLPIFAKWRRPLDDATLKIRIKWIMSRPVRTIKPQMSLAAIIEHMSQFRGRCLPVMDEEGNVQGIVTAFDVFQALLKHNSNTCSTEEANRELVKTASSTETT
jgi:CBS domain-containing protein